jgi:hypothetical protein
MALVSLPLIFWATRDTPTTVVDILKISMRPLLCIVTGAAVTWSAWSLIHLLTQPLVRLTVACAILFGVHAFVLRFVMGQKATYRELFKSFAVIDSTESVRRTEATESQFTRMP